MDYWLKGLILNHSLESYTINPIENAYVLKVMIMFMGVIRVPAREGRTSSGRRSS